MSINNVITPIWDIESSHHACQTLDDHVQVPRHLRLLVHTIRDHTRIVRLDQRPNVEQQVEVTVLHE